MSKIMKMKTTKVSLRLDRSLKKVKRSQKNLKDNLKLIVKIRTKKRISKTTKLKLKWILMSK
jgi:hypothetical protein